MPVAEPVPLLGVCVGTDVTMEVEVVVLGLPVPPGDPLVGPPPVGPPPVGPPPVWARTTQGLRANRRLVANANNNRRLFMTAIPTKQEKSIACYQFIGMC